jgi:hypothetical protein
MSDEVKHSEDCTIYSAMMNGNQYDGICTCGAGWKKVRETGDDRHLLSKERIAEFELKHPPMTDEEFWENLFPKDE